MVASIALETNPDLIARARAGDDHAWVSIVRQHEEPVFRLAYLILGDVDEAQDVAQGVFIRAYLKLAQYDDTRPFRPWLMGITSNLARNRQRSIGRYLSALQRFFHANREEAIAKPPGVDMAAHALWTAVRRLPLIAREVIYLRYFLGLSEAETAAALSIPKGTVKSRLSRALEKLRMIIENDFPELADERFSD